MDSIQIILILLFFAAIANTIAERIQVPVEIFLLVGSIFVSFIPGIPLIRLEPTALLSLFLPPILFSAAFFTTWRDFIANKRPITLLAVGLVLFTMCFIAIAMKFMIPGMSWTVAFLFGAIVSPTDASSAVTLVKKLKIPQRLITIIEGESLINDATALIAYRYALIALLTGTFSLWSASFNFLISGIGGIILGIAIGYISIRFYRWLDEPRSQNIFSIIVPYFAYILANHLGISGVICTVAAGMYFSREYPTFASAESRRKAEDIWEQFLFVINGLVFILIGLQLPSVLRGLSHYSISEIVFYAVIVNLTIILARVIWVFPAAYIPRLLSPSLRQRDPYPTWTQLLTLGWIGMRGMLSLAIVLALPDNLPNGESFPHRNLLIILTYSVILVSLLLPTLTLPALLKIFKFKEEYELCYEEATARIGMAKAGLKKLKQIQTLSQELKEYSDQRRKHYLRKIAILRSNLKENPYSAIDLTDQQIRRINKEVIDAERQELIRMRRKGALNDEIFRRLERELDLEEMRIKTQRL